MRPQAHVPDARAPAATRWHTIADGERILGGVQLTCRAPAQEPELPYLDESIETVQARQEREPEQTAAFRRVLQTAVLHVQSAQRQEVQAGDILRGDSAAAARRHAAQLLAEQGVTRLDVLEYISHGISKTPITADSGRPPGRRAAPATGRRRAGDGARSAVRVLRQPDRHARGRGCSTR